MTNYIVYLYKDPDCIRGWLAYIRPGSPKTATLTVAISANNTENAKHKAITAALHGFKGVEIIGYNHTDSLWGIDNFPELKEQLLKMEK